ncbi:MAG: thiamine pyrophosphate-binding protein [Alcaligenes sp.]
MTETITVGEAIARVLEIHQVRNVYGVISIHNLPIADALGRRQQVQFVCARGEAGSVTMADAESRFTGLGVALTSTGAGAGNAVGSLIEACNAASPVLHLTGQVEREYLDRDASFIHEAKDQLGFLRASSKAAYRISSPENAVGIIQEAIRIATTVPMGPVSVEIPIDVQAAKITWPISLEPVAALSLPALQDRDRTRLADAVRAAKRPMLWIGGGTLKAGEAIRQLADMGIPVVSSTHARGVLPDSHPRSLGAFHNAAQVEALLAEADLVLVVGSRLRSNETKTYSIKFPANTIQIDANPAAQQRNYTIPQFVCAEANEVLTALVQDLQGYRFVDADYDVAITQAREMAVAQLTEQLGPYAELCFALRAAMPEDAILVRDITMSGSTWGSRLFPVQAPLQNIHSLAGAIGLGLAHAIGTAKANLDKKVVALVGDGGLMLGIGEMATMVQEQSNLVLLVMNDGGYGVMRGIQKRYFDDRQYYNQLHTPSYRDVGLAMGCPSYLVSSLDEFKTVMAQAMEHQGPSVVEVDMCSIGPLNFSGPPQKKLY